MKITESDLLAALSEALVKPRDADGSTVAELVLATGYGHKRVLQALRALSAAGRLELAKALRPTIDGRIAPIPCYRIKP